MTLPPSPQNHKLEEADLHEVAARFGQSHVILTSNGKEGYLLFSQMANAFVCFQLLSRVALRGGSSQVSIEWVHNAGCHPEVAAQIHNFVLGLTA